MPLRAPHILSGLLVILMMSRPLGAQHPVVEAGVVAARFPDEDASAVGPLLRFSIAGARGQLFGAAEGAALGTFGSSTGFASASGGVRSSIGRGWSTELAGELAAVAGSNDAGSAQTGIAGARALWSSGAAGSWLRATGHASHRTETALSGGGVDAGAWWGSPRLQLTGALRQEWTRAELFTGRFRTGFAGTVPVRYAEATTALRAEGDYASFDAVAGVRRDVDAERTYEPTLSMETAWWPSGSMALVLAVTRQLPDWVRGGDAMNAVSVGLRFGQAAPVIARDARMVVVVQVAESDGAQLLRVYAAGASAVEVMGDFTDWRAQPLAAKGAAFEHTVTLSSGTHRVLVRVDGGPWRPAANTPAVDDDLGGRAGLLVIP
ncbi:MAG: glycogen-binding domain-containing protein [bacterium]